MRRTVPTGLLVVLATLAVPTVASAGAPATAPPPSEPPTSAPPEDEGDVGSVTGGGEVTQMTLPLVPVPVGCTAPRMPHIVFLGTVVDRDYRTIRFEIDQIRSGQAEPFAARGQIDIRYGLDAQYLHDDEQYLVGAVVQPELGLLVSRVTPPIEHFGGDEVIGVSETDVNCPVFEDPMRTLHVDGTEIDAGVLQPFLDAKIRILGAFLAPFGVAVGVIFLLAMFRLSLAGVYRSVVDGRRRQFG